MKHFEIIKNVVFDEIKESILEIKHYLVKIYFNEAFKTVIYQNIHHECSKCLSVSYVITISYLN